jgi:hypothetical protein
LDFSRDYRRDSDGVVKNRKRYLMVVVSGGKIVMGLMVGIR